MAGGQMIWDFTAEEWERKCAAMQLPALAQIDAELPEFTWHLEPDPDPTGRPPIDWLKINEEFS